MKQNIKEIHDTMGRQNLRIIGKSPNEKGQDISSRK